MKLQVNSKYPYQAVIKELLYHHECDRIQRPLTKYLDKRTLERNGRPFTQKASHEIPKRRDADWTEIRVMKK